MGFGGSIGKSIGKIAKKAVKHVSKTGDRVGAAAGQLASGDLQGGLANAGMLGVSGGQIDMGTIGANFGPKAPKPPGMPGAPDLENVGPDAQLDDEAERARRRGRASTILAGGSMDPSVSGGSLLTARRTLLGS